jgi:hypothetical protein
VSGAELRELAALAVTLCKMERAARTVEAMTSVCLAANELAAVLDGVEAPGFEDLRERLSHVVRETAASALSIASRWGGGRA